MSTRRCSSKRFTRSSLKNSNAETEKFFCRKKMKRGSEEPLEERFSTMNWQVVIHQGGESPQHCEFARVSNDVLAKIMSFFPREAWMSALLVCKRWASVGSGVFASLVSSKPIVFAMARGDEAQLRRWSSHPMMSPKIVDIHTLGIMCRNLRGRETGALRAFVDRCLTTKEEWKQCLMLACDGANAGALVVLEQKRVVAEWPATLEDYLGPITTLCRTAQIEALDALLGVMPVDLRNALLRDIKLCARCCLHNAHKALLFLVKRYGSVFIDESQEHAAEMCISLAYRAGSEDLLLAVLERTNFHNTQDGVLGLIGALERDWTRAAQRLAPFIQFDHAQAALRVAAIRGRAEAMRCLLEQPGTNPAFGNFVAIRESLENGHVDIALMLVKDHRVHLERDLQSACILLCSAIRCRKDACLFIEELIAQNVVDVNCWCHTPLRLALRERQFRVLRQLLLRPEIEMTKSEYSTVLALVSDETNGCKDILDIVLRSSRFEHHFGRSSSPMKDARIVQRQKKTLINRPNLLAANEVLDSGTSGEEEEEGVVALTGGLLEI